MADTSASEFAGATCTNCWRSPRNLVKFAGGEFVLCDRCAETLIAEGVKRRESALIMPTATFHLLPPRADWDKLGVKYGHHKRPIGRASKRAVESERRSKGVYPD